MLNNVDWLGLLALLGLGLVLYLLAQVAIIVRTLVRPARRGYGWAVSRGVPGDPGEVLVCEADSQPASPGDQTWAVRPQFVERTLRLGKGETKAWDIRGLNPSGPVAIMTHGWGDSRVVMLSRLPAFVPVCSRLILWDLPAHGDSVKGGICRLGVRERDDLLQVLDQLGSSSASDENPSIASANHLERVLLLGFSLGAGVAIAAAAELRQRGPHRLLGVIAEAPYRVPIIPARSVLRMRGLPHRLVLPGAMVLLGVLLERSWRGVRWARAAWRSDLSSGRAPNEPGIGASIVSKPNDCTNPPGFGDRVSLAGLLLDCPLLVLQGEHDEVCPPADGRSIATAAPRGRFEVIPGCGHLDMWTNAAASQQATAVVRAFIQAVALPTADASVPSTFSAEASPTADR